MKFMVKPPLNFSCYNPSCLKRATVLLMLVFLSACTSGPSGSSRVKEISAEATTKDSKALIHTKLARGYMEQKQYATARKELQRALRISPNHSPSNYVMALLMMKLEQLPEAESFFKRAVATDRENSAAAHDFGMFLCQTGKIRESIQYFEIAVANPLFKRAELSYMRAGECLSKINDDAAEAYLKKALSLNSSLRPALFRLALIKFDAKNYLSARAYIERYFAITEPQPESLLLAYKIESSLNAKDVADKYRKQLMRNFPSSSEARSVRGSGRT